METRAVLFDLDNTLFDHLASAHAGLEAFLGCLGTEPSGELASSWFEIEQVSYDRYLAKAVTFQEQRRERIRQFMALSGHPVPSTDTVLDELFAVYLQEYENAWAAFPDAAPALQRLKENGMMVGVITNGNHEQQTGKIARIGLAPLLDHVFSSGLMGHAKPSRQAFLRPCESLDLSPAETLFIGDDYRVDVEGARNAGLRAIHLARHDSERPGSIRGLADLPCLAGDARVPWSGPTETAHLS